MFSSPSRTSSPSSYTHRRTGQTVRTSPPAQRISCWLPATAAHYRVRADRGARRFHRADAFIREKPHQVWPSLYSAGAELKADKGPVRRIEASCFRSRRLVCGVSRSLTADSNVLEKRKTFKDSIFQCPLESELFWGFNYQDSLAETLSAEFLQLPSQRFLVKLF